MNVQVTLPCYGIVVGPTGVESTKERYSPFFCACPSPGEVILEASLVRSCRNVTSCPLRQEHSMFCRLVLPKSWVRRISSICLSVEIEMQQHGNCALPLLCVKRPKAIFTEADDNSTWAPPKRSRVAVSSGRAQMILGGRCKRI